MGTVATVATRSTSDRVGVRAAGGRWERHIVVDAVVSHPVASVFPYLADPMRWHEFAPACVYREQIDVGPPAVGTRWRATDRIGPFRAHFIDRLELLEPGRCAVWLSSDPWNSRVEYACAESDSVTRIHADYRGELGGALRWQTGWLPDFATHAILARDFVRLQRVLDRRADESRRWRRRHGAADPRAG